IRLSRHGRFPSHKSYTRVIGGRYNRVVMESFAEEPLGGRRLVVFGLTGASLLGFGLAMGDILASGGWSWPRLAILILFLAGMPWTLLGFWNSIIGFVILRPGCCL